MSSLQAGETYGLMPKTTLAQKEAIRSMLLSGKAYQEIATTLCLSLRTTRKWGQVIKKGGPCVLYEAGLLVGQQGLFHLLFVNALTSYAPV